VTLGWRQKSVPTFSGHSTQSNPGQRHPATYKSNLESRVKITTAIG
jgi:hypothetical protein